MSNMLIYIFLNLIGFCILVFWLFNTAKSFFTSTKKSTFFTWKRFKYPTLVSLIIGVPYVLINYTPLLNSVTIPLLDFQESTFLFNTLLAILISGVWIYYITRLDIYEPERWRDILLVFVLAIFTTYLCDVLYPIVHSFGLVHTVDPFSDFIYCVFGIGLIEELVKCIPLFVVLKFTKAVNEPYDYILYASLSALGFACAENIRYFNNYGFEIINARTFYAAVAHMTFSSTVAYGMLLHKFRFTKLPFLVVFTAFFGIAIVAHGFYDFWLINPSVADFNGITTLFFLITIHIWFVMKNNAINISNFYNASIELNNDKLKHYLVVSLTGIFTLSYVFIALNYPKLQAKVFFIQSIQIYGYVIFYLIASFSKFKVIKGYLRPFQVPFNILIPKINNNSKN